MDKNAFFSDDKKHRYVLQRIWDKALPKVMFIGLNPSTANETDDDPTIRRVMRFAKDWGYGGVYMLNLYSFVTAYPSKLEVSQHARITNDTFLRGYGKKSKEVVFAWGGFKEAKCNSLKMELMFPDATALQINADGSPKHPLYVKADIKRVNFSSLQ